MAEDHLLGAAGRIADGDVLDWGSITSTLKSDEDRAIAEELALVQQIAAGHRQLHELLPVAADTPPHLMPDRARWGHLDLLNVVGRGSYGIVYRAWDTRLERLVALKLFHGASNPDSVMQEGRMLARVRHENVVSVYGADVIDGVAGIWMELVHGQTLDNLVKRSGPFGPREAAAIGADIARALGAVHAAGLLHCDVKAQNVVRESSGRVVLMDLGSGRLVPEARDSDELSDFAGTPRYMAPELFAAGSTATKATDIYSLGVLIFYIVSGQFPVEGKTLGELKRAHEAGKRRALDGVRPELPRSLTEIVARAIDREPAARPWSAADLQSSLSAVASDPQIEPQVEPATKSSAGYWVVAAAGLTLLVVLLLRPLLTPAPPPLQSIAVIPIRNLTGDPAKQYLADGLTEVLVSHLARVPGLRVTSSATMAATNGSVSGEKALAEKLGVRLFLAGSVVQADNRIALSVQLTDPREGRTIWGTELERLPSTILGARSEIASLIAARLSLAKPPDQGTRQLKPEAQDAFLRGLADSASGSSARVVSAINYFSRAVELEPAWPDPLAHLAFAQQRAIEFGNPTDREARAAAVKANAISAIQLDPSLPMSYTALAAVQAYHEWDLGAAEGTLRQGLDAAVAGDATARDRLALVLAAANRLPEAVGEAEKARDQEPLVPERHTTLGIVRYYARDYDRALADMDRAIAMAPEYAPGYNGRARILAALGRFDESIESSRRALALSANPGWIAILANTFSAAGRRADLDETLRHLHALEAQGVFVSIDNYAYIAAHQGRFDEAFRLVETAIDRHMTNVLWLAVDPRADVLRSDARFDQLMSRMGVIAR